MSDSRNRATAAPRTRPATTSGDAFEVDLLDGRVAVPAYVQISTESAHFLQQTSATNGISNVVQFLLPICPSLPTYVQTRAQPLKVNMYNHISSHQARGKQVLFNRHRNPLFRKDHKLQAPHLGRRPRVNPGMQRARALRTLWNGCSLLSTVTWEQPPLPPPTPTSNRALCQPARTNLEQSSPLKHSELVRD